MPVRKTAIIGGPGWPAAEHQPLALSRPISSDHRRRRPDQPQVEDHAQPDQGPLR
jgi:hypothetical protein